MKLRERPVPGAYWGEQRTLNIRACGLVGDFSTLATHIEDTKVAAGRNW